MTNVFTEIDKNNRKTAKLRSNSESWKNMPRKNISILCVKCPEGSANVQGEREREREKIERK